MNLHDKFKKRMEEMAKQYQTVCDKNSKHLAGRKANPMEALMSEDAYADGYTQALTDVQGIVDELVEVLKECDYFCQDQKARANQAIATDCPDCDYQCVGCIHSIDDCDATSLKIRKALAKLNETDEGKV